MDKTITRKCFNCKRVSVLRVAYLRQMYHSFAFYVVGFFDCSACGHSMVRELTESEIDQIGRENISKKP